VLEVLGNYLSGENIRGFIHDYIVTAQDMLNPLSRTRVYLDDSREYNLIDSAECLYWGFQAIHEGNNIGFDNFSTNIIERF
jgi:hypothetical protein